MRMHSEKQTGFSLVELMVAVLVFGLLVAIAIPSVSGYMRTSRMSGASTKLQSDLRFAVSNASSQRTTYQILFQSGSYTLSRVSPATTIFTRQMPQGVACTASDTAKFFAWGLTKPVTVTMTDSHGSQTVQLLSNGNIIH